MKIGILGGTFDPVHCGHLALAKAAKEQYPLDKVVFVPAFHPPHKLDRPNLTPAPFRYRMVEMAIRNIPDFEISNVEFARQGISYTVDTLRQLKQQYPEDLLFLIMGADILSEIPQWKEPEEIRRLAEFLVAPRPDRKIRSPFPQGVHFIDFKELPVSASELREKLYRDEDIPQDWLMPEVRTYIRRMNLYQEGDPCRPS